MGRLRARYDSLRAHCDSQHLQDSRYLLHLLYQVDRRYAHVCLPYPQNKIYQLILKEAF